MQQKKRVLMIKLAFYVCAANCTVQQPREQPEQPGGVVGAEGSPRSTALAKIRGEDAKGVAGVYALQVPHRGASNRGASHRGTSSGAAGEGTGQGGDVGNVDQTRWAEAKLTCVLRHHRHHGHHRHHRIVVLRV